jgi:hypothetical protein
LADQAADGLLTLDPDGDVGGAVKFMKREVSAEMLGEAGSYCSATRTRPGSSGGAARRDTSM